MGYPAKAIANYFLELATKEKKEVTHLQIQKLVYIAHGWYLALYGCDKLLVDDEFAEAWEYGPVFPSIYYEFKKYGAHPIKEPAHDLRFDEFTEKWDRWTPRIRASSENKNTRAFLDHIWKLYKNFTGGQLSSLTHEDDTPWSTARNAARKNQGFIKNAHIENEKIERYYKEKLND